MMIAKIGHAGWQCCLYLCVHFRHLANAVTQNDNWWNQSGVSYLYQGMKPKKVADLSPW